MYVDHGRDPLQSTLSRLAEINAELARANVYEAEDLMREREQLLKCLEDLRRGIRR